MRPNRVYRGLGFAGTVTATVVAVLLADAAWLQARLAWLPAPGWAPPASPGGASLPAAIAVTVAVAAVALQPLYKPRSRRILDTVTATLRSLALAGLVLATSGYLGFPYRLPRATLVVATVALAVALPAWFVALQRRYLDGNGRTLVVGHDVERIEFAIRRATDPVLGYVSSSHADPVANGKRVDTDGGRGAVVSGAADHDRLGGISRLEEILNEANVGTVIPVLGNTDRAEFFGVLDTCHRHGVDVEVPAEHGESLLLRDDREGNPPREPRLAKIDLQPWDLQERLCKRAFDVCFAATALLVASPLVCLAALAVRLESGGPVLYRQERTALFGDTFHVYKLRSMIPESEVASPGEDDDRITRVGRVLRRTHLDEIPQLWSILRGQMSVVGPRAAWTAEEDLLLEETRTWQKRWFVKPGLTGLAQINDVSSETPEEKLQCDLRYIRRQSLRFDTKIIVRQLWIVLTDAASMLASFGRR